jgi:hypothetical protein
LLKLIPNPSLVVFTDEARATWRVKAFRPAGFPLEEINAPVLLESSSKPGNLV